MDAILGELCRLGTGDGCRLATVSGFGMQCRGGSARVAGYSNYTHGTIGSLAVLVDRLTEEKYKKMTS